jgi:predicted phage terminase large subunit-like protein
LSEEIALLESEQASLLLEIRRRETARTSLEHFCRYVSPHYLCEPAHALIAGTLDRVARGEIRRLMISAPPQHGKTFLTSIHFPAYWLGLRPSDPVIMSSYAASLVETSSRQARTILEGTEFRRLFPGVATRQDSRAVDHWQLADHRGGMLAVGVGGAVTGHGGLLGIIDDPFENWAQAQSETIRNKVWEWWRTTFRTRIWEAGAIVLIQTRWHEDDLAGRLLAEQGGEWTVLRLPATAESQEERDTNNAYLGLPTGEPDPLGRAAGEPLCPKRFSREALTELRRDVGSMAWAAEYQGTPRPAEGNRIKREWLPVVDPPPQYAPTMRVRYWDKASTEGGGCYTAGVLMARTMAGLYYVEDVVHGQWSAGERDNIMLATAKRDREAKGPTVQIWVEQEGGSGGKESAQGTIRMLAGYPIFAETSTDPKKVRIEPFAAQAEAGNVRLLRAPWNASYINEVTAFPNAAYNDQADGTSGAFNKLAAKPTSGGVITRPSGLAGMSQSGPNGLPRTLGVQPRGAR